MSFDNPAPSDYERWYVNCVGLSLSNDLAPGDYVFSLEPVGPWWDLYCAGITPIEAVQSQFCKQ